MDVDESLFNYHNGRRFVSSSEGRYTSSSANHRLVLNVYWGYDQGLKRPERKAYHSTQPSIEADNECSYTYNPP